MPDPSDLARPRLVLASASPRRHELLATLGIPFEVAPSHIEEPMHGDPAERAGELALEKARAAQAADRAADRTGDAPPPAVLGADTVVVLDGEAIGKPTGADEARSTLERLRGRTHVVVTAVAVVRRERAQVTSVASGVTMRNYDDAAIDAFITSGEPFDKAGGYALQDPDFAPVASLQGCECAVIGLPLWTARTLIEAIAGIRATAPPFERCAQCPERPRERD